jgi:exodeoxyribonuclease-3
MIKIASWNVNSIKARLEHVLTWLREHDPDVLCMQEIKATDEEFPTLEFKSLGYECVVSGQRTYNGVAILSKQPLRDVGIGFVDDTEGQARRLIEGRFGPVRIINVYVPNGQAVGSEKYAYKLDWLARLATFLRQGPTDDILLCGDFNVAPEPRDVYDPAALENVVLFSQPERDALQRAVDGILQDSFRLLHDEPKQYTWWDYRALAFRRKMGLRIDHVWLGSALAPRCKEAWIDVAPRKLEKPSDHAPIGVALDL